MATLLLHARLHSVSLNDINDKTKKRAFKQEALQDSIDAQSLTDPSEQEKIDGGVKFLKKMLADKCGDDNEQRMGADDFQHKHVCLSSPMRSYLTRRWLPC